MRLEIFGESNHLLATLAQKYLEQVEHDRPFVATSVNSGENLVFQKLHTRNAEHVVGPGTQSLAKRSEKSATAPATTWIAREPRQQAKHSAPRSSLSKMRCRRVLEMMTFVDHQSRVGRDHCGFIPVLLHSPDGNVRHQQMVVCDDNLRIRRFLP